VPPGACVLVNPLSHTIWDEVNRYRLTFTTAGGPRCMTEAQDLSLNALQLAQDPDLVWVAFGPAQRPGHDDDQVEHNMAAGRRVKP
jgi:hypothetical protein